MLQAYFDESQKDDMFVLAGYLSNKDSWDKFTREWQEQLKIVRSIAYKASRGWQTPSRIRRSKKFYKIIEDNVLIAVSCIINTKELQTAVDGMNIDIYPFLIKQLKNPYYVAFKAVISGLLKREKEFNLSHRVEFIFDEKTEKNLLINGWDNFLKTGPSHIKHLIKGRPIWCSDKEVLPLQAADLWAYCVRYWEEEQIPWQNGLPYPLEKRNLIPGLHQTIDIKGYIESIDRQISTNSKFIASFSSE
ncbi:MAG: DUF3800 domain-containing protein [Alphaproteobacteria bacterium]|nr:DUF3800 domain-containing protein [Alphaproteobacteria bacterium]